VSALVYGREALRRLREQQAKPATEPDSASFPLDQAPPDAPMDDAIITVWNGERFVAYGKWLANQPLVTEEQPESGVAVIPAYATCIAGDCGGTRIWLVKRGLRWTIISNSRGGVGGRRRDFASTVLENAMRTAEDWYGAPVAGWRVEQAGNAKGGTTNETADFSSQDSTNQEGTWEGHDDLDLDGR
jgi:hypothetical protein